MKYQLATMTTVRGSCSLEKRENGWIVRREFEEEHGGEWFSDYALAIRMLEKYLEILGVAEFRVKARLMESLCT